MYFNVNLKLLTKLINSAFVGVCVNCVNFKMHGAKIKNEFLTFSSTLNCNV